jgi:uncharacterized membrane protein
VDQVAGCTLINRPTVHTIYPPVAEAAFAAVHPFSAVLVLAGTRRRTSAAVGGVLLGLGIATKLTPALVLPSVVRP